MIRHCYIKKSNCLNESVWNISILPFSDSKDLQNAINKRLSGADLHPCTDSAPLWTVIKRMCAFDRTERYSSYDDPLRDFENILNTIYSNHS